MQRREEAWYDREVVKAGVAEWAAECGARLAARRNLLGISRKLMAQIAGTTESTVSRLESGRLNARDDLRWIFCGILQCNVADIWPHPTREQIVALRGAS